MTVTGVATPAITSRNRSRSGVVTSALPDKLESVGKYPQLITTPTIDPPNLHNQQHHDDSPVTMKQCALPSHGEGPAVIRSLQSTGCSLFASSLYSKNGVQRYWTANVPLGPVTVKPCSHDHFTCSPRRSMNADAASHDLLVATVAALQGQLRADAAQQDRKRGRLPTAATRRSVPCLSRCNPTATRTSESSATWWSTASCRLSALSKSIHLPECHRR
jgi:hypothetical protein